MESNCVISKLHLSMDIFPGNSAQNCPDLGVSENSVPLHPMVNDHYPYKMAISLGIYHIFRQNPFAQGRSSDAELRPSSPSSCRRSIASWLAEFLHHGDIERWTHRLGVLFKGYIYIYIYRPMMDDSINFWNRQFVVCKFIWKWLNQEHVFGTKNTLRDQYVGPIVLPIRLHGSSQIPSGKRSHNYGTSPFSMGKSTINRF